MGRPAERPLEAVVLGVVLLASSGCITVYHPLEGLHTPVVVDTDLANFEDLRLVVHCVPRDLLEKDAGLLCQQVRQLFENQGAEVETVTSLSRSAGEEEVAVETSSAAAASKRVELIVELRARHIHEHTDWAMWTLSWFTLTLAPGISENSFVQEVLIRDERGTVLVTGELSGRIVRYFGIGYWASNKLLDLTVRDDDEELSDDRLSELLSDDLYGHLSQMVFNAKMKRRVLGSSS